MPAKNGDHGADDAIPRHRTIFSSAGPRQEPGPDAVGAQAPLVSRRTLIISATMAAGALAGFILSAGVGDHAARTPGRAERTAGLRKRIADVRAGTQSLPDIEQAQRGTVMALSAAARVAGLQNGFQRLTPRIASGGGGLPRDEADRIRRSLAPLFAPTVDRATLGPWYLLASDRHVPAGSGLTIGFDSGMEWEARVAATIGSDGRIPVVWLALPTHQREGQPTILAWAASGYDIRRSAFSGVETGTTVAGESLRQAVIR